MSRVGKEPILLTENIKVHIKGNKIEYEGPKGKNVSPILPGIKAEVKDKQLSFTRRDDSKLQKSYHGLCRSLAFNAVTGISSGFSKQLEIVGIGYKAKLDKNKLELNIGYSKPVAFEIPDGIEIVLEKPTLITVKGIDKQLVGQVAKKIHDLRKPDPYKLKGIRFVGERLIKKERKAGVANV
jgi:large subunit ribosomal protein L6